MFQAITAKGERLEDAAVATPVEDIEPDNLKATTLVTGDSFSAGRPLSEVVSARQVLWTGIFALAVFAAVF